jgi:hypothetical protein
MRYHATRDQDAADYSYLDYGPPIDATKGSPRPELRPPSAYKNPRHDAVLRYRLDHAAQHAADGDLADQLSWDELVNRPADTRVTFYPPPGSEMNIHPFRGSASPQGALVNPAASGELYQRRPAVSGPGRGHLAGDRFGRR